jgi:hypothetical protein
MGAVSAGSFAEQEQLRRGAEENQSCEHAHRRCRLSRELGSDEHEPGEDQRTRERPVHEEGVDY